MKLKITKTYDNPNDANGYGGTIGNLKPLGKTFHSEQFRFEIGSIEIGLFSFRDNQCSNFTLKTTKKSDDGLDVYFLLQGKSYDEIVNIITEWLNNE
jgi:hypothetical protein